MINPPFLPNETVEQRQERLLADEDYRFHALFKIGTGLGMLATAEKLPTVGTVTFGLPSAPALMLNVARSAYHKRQQIPVSSVFAHDENMFPNWKGLSPIGGHQRLFDYFEYLIEEVIFSLTAVEAFANESIPKDFEYCYKRKKKEEGEILVGSEIEQAVSLSEKLSAVLPSALKASSVKGTIAWEKYRKLEKVRDRIIHMKTIDYRPSGPGVETIWGDLLRAHKTKFYKSALMIINHFIGDRRWHQIFTEEDGSTDVK